MQKVCVEEVFGLVVVLEKFDDFDNVIKFINDSKFGLQVGVFIKDIYYVYKVWDELEVGGVVIGDIFFW